MMPARHPEPPESVLAAAAGVRSLALALARDAHAADDLTQEACLRALERRPWLNGEDVRPWFARVVRNLAQLGRRSDARRHEREQLAARLEHQPSSAEILERAELHRALVAEVMALREPYRRALLLRYLEGLPPRTIAKRLDVPVSTVNARLARGLALLRERAGPHDQGHIRFLALALPVGGRGTHNLLQGGVIVSTKSKLAAALVLVLALGAGGPSLWDALTASTPPSAVRPPIEPASAREASATPTLLDAPSPTRELAAASDNPAPDPERDLHGIVLFPDGSPAPGVALSVLRPLARQVAALPLDESADERVAELRSLDDGTFRVPLEPGLVYDLEVAPEHHARQRIGDRYAGEFVRVVLEPGLTLRGRVTVAPDGAPVEGVELLVQEGVIGTPGRPLFRARTDADGRYELRHLPHGFLRLRVRHVQRGELIEEVVTRAPTSELQRDLEYPRGTTLHGRVADAISGAPVPGAEVSTFTGFPAAQTDANGDYELPGLSAGRSTRVTLRVRAPGYGRWFARIQAPLPEPELRQDFTLLAARRAHGRVVDGDGAPIPGARVLARERERELEQTDRVEAVTDDRGRFELENLRADMAHTLLVHRAGLATATVDLPPDEHELDLIELGDVVMRRPARLAGLLLTPDGEPLADLRVLLTYGAVDSGGGEPAWFREGFGAGRITARTDARGRWSFVDLPAGRFYLSAGEKGWARRAELELSLAEGEAADDVLLELDPEPSIRGVLEDEHGAPLVHVAVRASRDGARGTYDLTRVDGRFGLFGLEPGVYTLTVSTPGSFVDRHFEGIAAGTHDLRLGLGAIEPVTLEGTVLTPDGEPVPGCHVTWTDSADSANIGTVSADRAGRFRIQLVAGTTVDLAAFPSAEDRPNYMKREGFENGRTIWSYRVERASVSPDAGEVTLVLPEAPPTFPRFETVQGASVD